MVWHHKIELEGQKFCLGLLHVIFIVDGRVMNTVGCERDFASM